MTCYYLHENYFLLITILGRSLFYYVWINNSVVWSFSCWLQSQWLQAMNRSHSMLQIPNSRRHLCSSQLPPQRLTGEIPVRAGSLTRAYNASEKGGRQPVLGSAVCRESDALLPQTQRGRGAISSWGLPERKWTPFSLIRHLLLQGLVDLSHSPEAGRKLSGVNLASQGLPGKEGSQGHLGFWEERTMDPTSPAWRRL